MWWLTWNSVYFKLYAVKQNVRKWQIAGDCSHREHVWITKVRTGHMSHLCITKVWTGHTYKHLLISCYDKNLWRICTCGGALRVKYIIEDSCQTPAKIRRRNVTWSGTSAMNSQRQTELCPSQEQQVYCIGLTGLICVYVCTNFYFLFPFLS